MALRKNTALVNAQAEFNGEQWDGGTLEIYTGGQPANANTAPSGSLLVTIDIPSPAFGSPTAGVVTKSGSWTDTATGDGTAGWARFTSADTLKVMDVLCSDDPLDTDDLLLNTVSITIGITVTVVSLTITEPAS